MSNILNDPLNSLKNEAIDRMRVALLSSALDDPLDAANAIRQVTVMRIYHQVARIVQYLDLMDKLEQKLYQSIEDEIDNITFLLDEGSATQIEVILKLLGIQEKLQKSIIESNKLLQPYLDIDTYPAFNSIEAATPVDAQILELESSERNLLRENAGAILHDLKALQASNVD